MTIPIANDYEAACKANYMPYFFVVGKRIYIMEFYSQSEKL